MLSCEPHGFAECYVNVWLWYIVPVVLLIIGTVGNILNIIILARRRMRKYPTTVYLLLLAVSDMTSLWISLMPIYADNIFDVNFRTRSQFFCKWVSWMMHAMAHFSIWLLVLMTVERVLLTISPVFARAHLTRKNAIIAAMTILVLCLSLSLNFVFGLELKTITVSGNHGNETVTRQYKDCLPASTAFVDFYRRVWGVLALILVNLVPLFIILTGNGVILITLLLQRRRLRRIKPTETKNNMAAFRNRKSSTKMLFLICGVFMVTTLPYTISGVVLSSTVESDDTHNQARTALFRSFTVLLLFCNFTFNFVLYFLSGTMFKQEWTRLVAEVKTKFGKVLRRSDTSEARSTNTAAMVTDTQDTPLDLH